MSSIPTPPSSDNTASSSGKKFSIYLLGWLVGGSMICNGALSLLNEKSAIHQIYTTLNLGFGVQLVLTSFALKDQMD